VLNAALGPIITQQQVLSVISAFLPSTSTDVLDITAENVAQALQQGRSFGLVAIISLAWSGLGLFASITLIMDTTFRIERVRSVLAQRLIAILMALILLILVAVSFLTSGVLRVVMAVLPPDQPAAWLWIATFFLPFSLNLVIFALLLRYVPARHVHWDAIWPAAFVGALGWEIAKALFGWYLDTLANFQFIYGTLSTGIALLFWAYLLAMIFILTCELCAAFNDWHEAQQRPALSLPADTA
jgi:membrane protein